MLALMVVTLRLYPIYWFIDTTRSLNSQGERKISTGFMVVCSAFLAPSELAFVTSEWFGFGPWWHHPFMVLILIPLTALWLIWGLRLRSQFNAYVHSRQGDWLEASLLWTVLLQQYYLQFKINQAVDAGLLLRVPASPVRAS